MSTQNFSKLHIVLAVYGLKTVTENIQNLITQEQPGELRFTVNNKVIGEDGWLGQKKSIMIIYNYDDGDLHLVAGKEGDIININPYVYKTTKPLYRNAVTNNAGLTVLAATYGPEDVTEKVQELISPYKTAYFRADNSIFEDTWFGVAKTLVVVLGDAREIYAVEVFAERESCYIDLNDAVPMFF